MPNGSMVLAFGYVSIIKLLIYTGMFFLWMPLINWVHGDAQAVRTKVNFWTGLVAGIGAATLVLWLFAPMFIIGVMIFLISVSAVCMAYVVHRNARVADFEKILTAAHIKSLFVDENKKIAKASKGIVLVTANGNDVPLPKPKSPEAFGFQTTCEVFEDAVWRRASEVAFQPGKEDYSLIYRIDGQPIKQDPVTSEDMEFFLHYLKQLCDLDANERRKPQSGAFTIKKDDEAFKWEVTTAGSTAGEQVRAKRLDEYNIMKLEELGMTEEQVNGLKTLKELQKGLIIVSGPKKTGVTTTFYALLRNHDPFLNDINTLEKNPAAELQNITQHTYKMSDTGTSSYAQKFTSVVRMGPNIVGVADCEEDDCFKAALQACQGGRLVHLATEATSVIKALGKVIKNGGDKLIVLDNVSAIVNQRLVRKLCSECKQAYQPNQALLKKFNLSSDKIKLLYRPGDIEYDKHGNPIYCEQCQGTGFFGRIGIYETIIITDEIRAEIKQAKNLHDISTIFRNKGMLYMQEQSISKVTEGITSINEVIREFSTAKPPQKKKSK